VFHRLMRTAASCEGVFYDNETQRRTDESLIALRRILRATELFERDLARAVGLSPAQLRVLQVVSEKSSATPKTLATQMG
jgi:hypothetical protein